MSKEGYHLVRCALLVALGLGLARLLECAGPYSYGPIGWLVIICGTLAIAAWSLLDAPVGNASSEEDK